MGWTFLFSKKHVRLGHPNEHTLALCQLVKEVRGAAIEDAGSQDAVPQTLTRSEDENHWDVKKKQNLTI